ncbi:MAG: hypothetical protein ACOH1T_08840 [Microbacteriaceae bacterium]
MSRKTTSPDSAPSWQTIDGRSEVSFFAIPLRMRTLALGILAIVICGGLGLAAMLIVADGVFGVRSGSRAIVLLGTLLALPAALIFVRALQRRTVSCLLRFDADLIGVDVGDEATQIPLREVDQLTWRQDSDYARVVVRADTRTISLITGLVRRKTPVLLQLPALPPDIIRLLVEAGLTQQPSKSTGLVKFTRQVR